MDIFTNKGAWFRFAEEHNRTADASSVLLNGSDSYSLAACHLAADIPIQSSVRLDVQRAKGVADHFSGLRAYYEDGVASKKWLPSLMARFRQFARQNSLDPDELIKRIIVLTENGGRKPVASLPHAAAPASDTSGRECYLPGRAEFEAAYLRVAGVGEDVDLDVVLEEIETAATGAGLFLQGNWRDLMESQIETWLENGEPNGNN